MCLGLNFLFVLLIIFFLADPPRGKSEGVHLVSFPNQIFFAHVTVAHLSFQEATQSSYVEDLRYIGGGQIFGILLLVTFLKLVSKFMVK
jgi:hypothetical protein